MSLSVKELILLKLATILKINLKGLAYRGVGIGLPNDSAVNGEVFLIDQILPKLLSHNSGLVIFDVGANAGGYTEHLSKRFSEAQIYSFEPNPNTFKVLKEKFETIENIVTENIGLGATNGSENIYYYKKDKTTGHASLNPKVFELHKREDLDSSSINIETIDQYCKGKEINRINFIKIDTEGYEYNVLIGASEMLKAGKIDLIQFEFNEMNIMNRIFLKDFYDILEEYELYRLKRNTLFPLKEYSSKEEVFIIQNILAVKKELTSKINELTA